MSEQSNQAFEEWWQEGLEWMESLTSVKSFSPEQLKNIAHSAWNKSREDALLDSYERLKEDVKFLLSKHAPD